MSDKKGLGDLLDVMAALRTPGSGCPWDLAQDYASIIPYTLEEAYEVADAIERGDMAGLRDELGDLLFQVVFYARLAEEDGRFDFSDVVDAITRKMIRRHPHVFGDASARSAGEVRGQWERIKAQERQTRAAGNNVTGAEGGTAPQAGGALDDIPLALPALRRAVKLQDRAARLGFDWPSLAPVLAKLREEWGEFEAELGDLLPIDDHGGDDGGDGVPPRPRLSIAPAQRARLADELGDMMFVIANIARHLDIDPEAAMRGANSKFVRRFRYIEQRLAAAGKTPEQSDLDEMDKYWNEAREAEKNAPPAQD